MISEGYVTNGAKVYITSRDAKACQQACDELNALAKENRTGGEARWIAADFYKEEDCKKMAEELAKRERGRSGCTSMLIQLGVKTSTPMTLLFDCREYS